MAPGNQIPNCSLPPTHGWRDCFRLLRDQGFDPKAVLDAGANHGEWTRAALEFFPSARYLLVEPQDHLKAHVDDLLSGGRDIRWLTAGVGNRSGRECLTVTPNDVSSTFILDAPEAKSMGFAQVPVRMTTINEIVRTEFARAPDLVKLDVEGYELKAIEGASDIMGKTEVFFLEAAVCASRLENTVAAVIRTMENVGYRVVDITDINRKPHGLLWLCELVFLREASPLLTRLQNSS